MNWTAFFAGALIGLLFEYAGWKYFQSRVDLAILKIRDHFKTNQEEWSAEDLAGLLSLSDLAAHKACALLESVGVLRSRLRSHKAKDPLAQGVVLYWKPAVLPSFGARLPDHPYSTARGNGLL